MRILLDHGVPFGVVRLLSAHEVVPAVRIGWDQLKNGELLRRAEADEFHLLITNDKNMSYQQNLSGRQIAVLVLSNCRWADLKNVAAELCKAVEMARPGEFQLFAVAENLNPI
jgi:hypothetical protein